MKSAMLAGAVGGASPNLIQLAMMCSKHGGELPTPSFYIGVFIYAMMGAIVTWVWQDPDLRKAFYVGIGLPAFIQANVGNYSELNKGKPETGGKPMPGASLFVSSAYAEETNLNTVLETNAVTNVFTNFSTTKVQTAITNRILEIQPTDHFSKCEVLIFSAKDEPLEASIATVGETERITLPAEAAKIILKGANFAPVQQNLQFTSDSITHLKLKTEKRKWSGLEKALGVKGVKDYQLQTTTTLRSID